MDMTAIFRECAGKRMSANSMGDCVVLRMRDGMTLVLLLMLVLPLPPTDRSPTRAAGAERDLADRAASSSESVARILLDVVGDMEASAA